MAADFERDVQDSAGGQRSRGDAQVVDRRADAFVELFLAAVSVQFVRQRKTPGSFLPGVLSVSSLSGSEVTLSANVQEQAALILELVDSGRLGDRREGRRTTAPVNFWSRRDAPNSAENVRFLTGVQRVIIPTWAMLKSGLQLPTTASRETAFAQIDSLAVVANRSSIAPQRLEVQ